MNLGIEQWDIRNIRSATTSGIAEQPLDDVPHGPGPGRDAPHLAVGQEDRGHAARSSSRCRTCCRLRSAPADGAAGAPPLQISSTARPADGSSRRCSSRCSSRRCSSSSRCSSRCSSRSRCSSAAGADGPGRRQGFPPGARVMVAAHDGNRYPATVAQMQTRASTCARCRTASSTGSRSRTSPRRKRARDDDPAPAAEPDRSRFAGGPGCTSAQPADGHVHASRWSWKLVRNALEVDGVRCGRWHRALVRRHARDRRAMSPANSDRHPRRRGLARSWSGRCTASGCPAVNALAAELRVDVWRDGSHHRRGLCAGRTAKSGHARRARGADRHAHQLRAGLLNPAAPPVDVPAIAARCRAVAPLVTDLELCVDDARFHYARGLASLVEELAGVRLIEPLHVRATCGEVELDVPRSAGRSTAARNARSSTTARPSGAPTSTACSRAFGARSRTDPGARPGDSRRT